VGLAAAGVGVLALGMVVTARGVPRHVAADFALTRHWAELSLHGDSSHAAEGAPRIVERLRALHHRAEVISATGDRIRLRVSPVEGDARAAVTSVLAPGRLEFYCAADDQTPVSPAGGEVAGLETRSMGSRPVYLIYEAATLEALAPVIARSEAAPGALTRTGCEEPYEPHGRPRCYALRLDPSRSITNADLASTGVELDTYDARPYVSLRFTPAGATRFTEITTACVRRAMSIVIDGRIHSAPIVQTPITGGFARITLGTADNPRRMLEEARALAASLRTGALAARWTIDG
jgi:preprotein translocase subunit SecD